MKIAVVTEDGQNISEHFGRAPYYLVFTVEDGEIADKELRGIAGHHQFVREHHHHHTEDDRRGHGFGAHSQAKHIHMIDSIKDCEAIIARGMGSGAYRAMEDANIRPFITDVAEAEEAVKAYVAGTLTNHIDRLH
jgi:predicted Fe-Mo cluster-binding NifX family protein